MIMGILDRYIGRSILTTSLLVLLTLVSLAGIFSFISELDDVGKGSYSVAKAMQYVFLTLPGKAYLLFAPSVLLGSLLGLGALATNSELTVMRAAGVANSRIIRAVLITGFALMILIAVIGETIMPRTEQIAEQLRLTALEKRLTVKGRNGLWVKSGDVYVNISTVMPDFTLLDIDVAEFDGFKLVRSINAARAIQVENDWQLEEIKVSNLLPNSIETLFYERKNWKELASNDKKDPSEVASLVSADVLKSLSTSPDTLSAQDLYSQAKYLKENQLDSRTIELAIWVKIANPFATLVMLMLSLPFVFSSQRGGGAGQKIFIGIMLGIGYVLANKLLVQLALANGLSPAISAFSPLIFFFIIAVIGIKRSA